jgi:mRNA-degrading endonuclease RelE of RelBE toxin-antitoxin system
LKLVITEPAWESYANALRFLAGYLTDRELARWDARLWTRIAELKKFPQLGAYEPYLEHKEEGHRKLVIGKFKVIYRIEGRTVYVTDIFDARQDPRKMKA